ncbi:MAG: hypothetical protein RL539_579, partial [Pseudomonadota bacterium]
VFSLIVVLWVVYGYSLDEVIRIRTGETGESAI